MDSENFVGGMRGGPDIVFAVFDRGGGLSESPATNNWNPLGPITSRVESKLVTLM